MPSMSCRAISRCQSSPRAKEREELGFGFGENFLLMQLIPPIYEERNIPRQLPPGKEFNREFEHI